MWPGGVRELRDCRLIDKSMEDLVYYSDKTIDSKEGEGV